MNFWLKLDDYWYYLTEDYRVVGFVRVDSVPGLPTWGIVGTRSIDENITGLLAVRDFLHPKSHDLKGRS